MAKYKIISKIREQINSLEKKIDGVSGYYLTNTPKRQNEQRRRDEKKEIFQYKLKLLKYLSNEAYKREITPFETSLLTGTFYEAFKSLACGYRDSGAVWAELNGIDEKLQKALGKAGIKDNESFRLELERFISITGLAVTQGNTNAKRLRDLVFEARNNQGGDIQFTPEPVAEYLVSLAGITQGSKVMEPEAGIASIADKAKEITRDVDCVEICQSFHEILELKGHNVVGKNLFEYEQRPVYDAVVMNPPFSAEIEHIKYAFGFLKPGGVLASVCSSRFTYAKNKGYPEFYDWLKAHELYYENGGEKFEKTGTASLLIRIRKGETAA